MKETKLSEAFLSLAKNLSVVAQELPEEIKKLEGNVSEADLRKVSDVLNTTDFQGKVNELDKARKQLRKMAKDVT